MHLQKVWPSPSNGKESTGSLLLLYGRLYFCDLYGHAPVYLFPLGAFNTVLSLVTIVIAELLDDLLARFCSGVCIHVHC